MLRTLLFTALAVVATAAAIAGAVNLRARQDAQRLTREAELVLLAPRRRSADLSKLDATRALRLLEEASDIHDDPHTQGVMAWATALDEYQKGRAEPATKALAAARRKLPVSADLDTLTAAVAIQAGRTGEAHSFVQKALALDPKHIRARMLAADLAADAGETERAHALLQSLVKDAPEDGALYNRLGLTEDALGNDEAALIAWERAAELDPSLPQPHVNLGRLLREQGRARDAERAFAMAIQRAASEPEAWLGRGLSRIALGDLEGGRADIQQARQLAPAEPAPLVALADLDVWHGQLAKAIERYRAALVLSDQDAVAWLKLGNALTRTRAYAEARSAFERALALRPDLAAAQNGLGAVLMTLGEREAAERAFARAAELDTQDPNPLLNLALLHKRHASARSRRGQGASLPRDASAKLD